MIELQKYIYIEYIKIYKKIAVADLKIIDKRYESVGNDVRDIDIQFDRLSDDCKCDKTMTMRICWFDFTSDGHEGKDECDKLYAKLVKRNNVYGNKYHCIVVYKDYNCSMSFMDITCFKGHRIIPLIYLTTHERNNK